MQIVIELPEIIAMDIAEGFPQAYIEVMADAIRKGRVLPKHGRLIDADELKKHKYHDNDRFENAVAVAQIDWADTIIEADKGEGSGEE